MPDQPNEPVDALSAIILLSGRRGSVERILAALKDWGDDGEMVVRVLVEERRREDVADGDGSPRGSFEIRWGHE